MALLHHAQLVPSKLDLVAGWITAQPFGPADADPSSAERIASFRFDDPAGKVGIETLIVRAGDATFQVPLTYREAPLAGAEASLIGTMEHSVLGTRYTYDAVGDPVYVAELVRAAVSGGSEVERYYEEDGERKVKQGDAHARGTGHPGADVPAVPADASALVVSTGPASSVVSWDAGRVTVTRRIPDASAPAPADARFVLLGSWGDVHDAVLATAG